MASTQRITKKYKVAISELQTWTEYGQDSNGEQVAHDCQEWTETDAVESSRKPTIAAFLRGLANELDPPKSATRSYDG